MHRTLWDTFSGIARDFGLWVVAGSALLPASQRGHDTPDFAPYGARTYNTSYTFSPEGRCVAAVRKVNLVPTQDDALHLSPGRPEDLTLVPTPFGRLGTLIGYDGFLKPHTRQEPWFVPCAQYLDALGADLLAQPSATAARGAEDTSQTSLASLSLDAVPRLESLSAALVDEKHKYRAKQHFLTWAPS